MKNLTRLSAGTLLLAITTLFSCQKVLVNPTITSEARTSGALAVAPTAFHLNVSVIQGLSPNCIVISANVKNNGGGIVNSNTNSSMTVTVTNPDGTVNANTPFTYTAEALAQNNVGMQFSGFTICEAAPGTYTINVCSVHTPNNNSAPVNICTTITYTVMADCSLNPVTLSGHAYDIGLDLNGVPNGEIKSTFNVNVCSGSYTALKLQGGLVSGATAPTGDDAINNPTPATPWAYISPDGTGSAYDGNDDVNTLVQVKKLNSNWTITWAISSLSAGYSKDYTIRYHKNLMPGTNNVTGAWSLKSNSILVAGYTDRLTVSY